MVPFSLLHCPKLQTTQAFAPPSSWSTASPVFDTCQRRIWINPPLKSQYQLPREIEFFSGEGAYQFMLEVLCGLHSRVFGETEIQGQFRSYYRENPFLKPVGSWLLEDAKVIRSHYLQDLGGQSYGSIIRRWCSAHPSIAILGTGQLATKLHPWIPHALLLKSRDLRKLPKTSAVIIAAPLDDQLLHELDQDQFWIDLRAERGHFQADFNLENLFSEIENDSKQHHDIRATAKSAIQELTETRFNQLWCRPQGWEDLT